MGSFQESSLACLHDAWRQLLSAPMKPVPPKDPLLALYDELLQSLDRPPLKGPVPAELMERLRAAIAQLKSPDQAAALFYAVQLIPLVGEKLGRKEVSA